MNTNDPREATTGEGTLRTLLGAPALAPALTWESHQPQSPEVTLTNSN